MDFKHFSITSVGQVRTANEDNYGDRMTANGYVFVVCDGMGGHVGGATASRIAVESILDFFENPVQNIYVGINDAFQYANSRVLNASNEDPSLQGMGTTGVILVINQDACFIGHVGDSRIYLKSDGRLNRLTKDHSFVQTLVDQGIINDSEAEEHPKKNQILEALGIKAQVNPTICESPVQPKIGDCFLLCSDGLNGMIKDSVIEELIDPNNIENSGKDLIDAANRAGGTDNITATLVTITESPYSTSVFKHFNPATVHNAPKTLIEPMIGEEPKKKNRALIYIVGSIMFIALLFLGWYFIFNNGSESKPKNNSVKEVEGQTKNGEEDKNDEDQNKKKTIIDKTKNEGKSTSKTNNAKEDTNKSTNPSPADVPEDDTNKPAESALKTHTVKSGESLSVIAAKYGVTPDGIIKINTEEGTKLSKADQDKLKEKQVNPEWVLIIPTADENK